MVSDIKNRHTGEIICSGECSVKELAEANKANLSVANLSVANLSLANLRDANMREANLYVANLSWTDLCDADLRGACLREANLSVADLSLTDLCDADLRGANLYGANLSRANLYGANLSVANLLFSDMSGAVYGAETLLKHLSISPIGSRNDCLQVFITPSNIYLRTGCWSGTLEGLLERTAREDYKEAVDYILTVARRVRLEVQGE